MIFVNRQYYFNKLACLLLIFAFQICFADEDNKEYASNIQIAPLNCLNATFAVIKFYKHYGVLNDLENEHQSTYSINVNQLVSDEVSA